MAQRTLANTRNGYDAGDGGVRMSRGSILAITIALVCSACSDDSGASSSITPVDTESCEYYDVEGCSVFGLVLAEPAPTAEALAALADLPGVPIAVWRTDPVCVLEINTFSPVDPVPTIPSRFAYVDAEGIRARRLATQGSVAPPITGLHISESFWNHWEDQWAQAQEPGAIVEAVALYLLDSAARSLAEDPRIRSIVPLSSRRTDSIDPSYTGELLLESESFPSGYLTEPTDLACR